MSQKVILEKHIRVTEFSKTKKNLNSSTIETKFQNKQFHYKFHYQTLQGSELASIEITIDELKPKHRVGANHSIFIVFAMCAKWEHKFQIQIVHIKICRNFSSLWEEICNLGKSSGLTQTVLNFILLLRFSLFVLIKILQFQDCRQPFQGGSFFDHEGLPYCETHYHAKRGSLCAGCSKPITGRCITAMFRKFHPEHFVCAFCLKQLNKGTFKEQNDKPYCHGCFDKLFG